MVTDMFIQWRKVRSFAAWQCPQESIRAIHDKSPASPWALRARMEDIVEHAEGFRRALSSFPNYRKVRSPRS